MSELVIIILLIIIIFLYKNEQSSRLEQTCSNNNYDKYKPITVDSFLDEPKKIVENITPEKKEEATDFSDIIKDIPEEDSIIYDMFINKLSGDSSENRIFKSRLKYDYRNIDAIEKFVKQSNHHHMTQRHTL